MRLHVATSLLLLLWHPNPAAALTRLSARQTVKNNWYGDAVVAPLIRLASTASSSSSSSLVVEQAEETDSNNDNKLVAVETLLQQGRTAKQVWRPDKQDVERISWGKPAKKKGTGSRGVPHRLNQDERQLFDQARSKGVLEVVGSAWRSQRRDAPLLNTYRNWCDACAHVNICLHKSQSGQEDAVVVDISPLRLETEQQFQRVADACLKQQSGGTIRNQASPGESTMSDNDNDNANANININYETAESSLLLDSNAWEARPIYQLPPYCIVWDSLQRAQAKQLAKHMAEFCQTANKGREKASKKPVGVKHGKSRRHGGYGIG